MNFDTETILTMDYRALRRYVEEAILLKPSLSAKLLAVNVREAIDKKASPDKMARLRCVSAYMGISDPLRNIG